MEGIFYSEEKVLWAKMHENISQEMEMITNDYDITTQKMKFSIKDFQ